MTRYFESRRAIGEANSTSSSALVPPFLRKVISKLNDVVAVTLIALAAQLNLVACEPEIREKLQQVPFTSAIAIQQPPLTSLSPDGQWLLYWETGIDESGHTDHVGRRIVTQHRQTGLRTIHVVDSLDGEFALDSHHELLARMRVGFSREGWSGGRFYIFVMGRGLVRVEPGNPPLLRVPAAPKSLSCSDCTPLDLLVREVRRRTGADRDPMRHKIAHWHLPYQDDALGRYLYRPGTGENAGSVVRIDSNGNVDLLTGYKTDGDILSVRVSGDERFVAIVVRPEGNIPVLDWSFQPLKLVVHEVVTGTSWEIASFEMIDVPIWDREGENLFFGAGSKNGDHTSIYRLRVLDLFD